MPIEALILEMCDRWKCTPSQLMKEHAKWFELGYFYYAKREQIRNENETAST